MPAANLSYNNPILLNGKHNRVILLNKRSRKNRLRQTHCITISPFLNSTYHCHTPNHYNKSKNNVDTKVNAKSNSVLPHAAAAKTQPQPN